MLKLRYKLLSSLSACALAFMPMACTEEQNLAQPDNNQEELEPAVGFTGSMNSPSSRTSGEYGKIDATNLGIGLRVIMKISNTPCSMLAVTKNIPQRVNFT